LSSPTIASTFLRTCFSMFSRPPPRADVFLFFFYPLSLSSLQRSESTTHPKAYGWSSRERCVRGRSTPHRHSNTLMDAALTNSPKKIQKEFLHASMYIFVMHTRMPNAFKKNCIHLTTTWRDSRHHCILQVYDVTKFQHTHPGGSGALRRSAGKDVTEVYNLHSLSNFS
jgi:hypothetical protein